MARFDNPPYYITAYGLAVKRGYMGTLDQWLESLRGDRVELRTNGRMIQWRWLPRDPLIRLGAEDGWTDLMDTAALDGHTPERGVDYWTDEDKTEIVEQVLDALPEDIPSDYVKTVNGVEPDENGNVEVEIPVTSVNGQTGDVVVEQIKPDWNQNDETAADYVKNRTHWVEDPVESVLVEEMSVTTEEGYVQISDTLTFTEGQTYRVVFDGTEYNCVAWAGDDSAILIGNGSIYGGDGGNDEPFCCDSYANGVCYLNVSDNGTFTISIVGAVAVIHKIDKKFLPTIAGQLGSGLFAEVFNLGNDASGYASHTEGIEAIASGGASHAEGYRTIASSEYVGVDGSIPSMDDTTIGCHAEGVQTVACANGAHAEGFNTGAYGYASHSEGDLTVAYGYTSHSEGRNTKAIGDFAHSEGQDTKAIGDHSHAEGNGTVASGNNSHAQGKYNIEDTDGVYAHIVGNGLESARSNAHTIDWDGNGWFAGTVECTALILKSSTEGSEKRFRITVGDDGVLTATETVTST